MRPSETISLFDDLTVTETAEHGKTKPSILFSHTLKDQGWWGRFTTRLYSPVWRRYRGARLVWVGGWSSPTWLRVLMVLHELVARTPIVQWEIKETR